MNKKYIILTLLGCAVIAQASRLVINGGSMTFSPSILPDPRDVPVPRGYTLSTEWIASDLYTNVSTVTLSNRVTANSSYALTNASGSTAPTRATGTFNGYDAIQFTGTASQFLRCVNYTNNQYAHWFLVMSFEAPRDTNYKFIVDGAYNTATIRQQMLVNSGNRAVVDSGTGISSDTFDLIRTNIPMVCSIKINPDGLCTWKTNFGTWFGGDAGNGQMHGLTMGADRNATPGNPATMKLWGVYGFAGTNLNSASENLMISNIVSAYNINTTL